MLQIRLVVRCFNTQPPEGGWDNPKVEMKNARAVSTHRRLKAAGMMVYQKAVDIGVSTHSRLKAAGIFPQKLGKDWFCFNTQPPEGGWGLFRMRGYRWLPFQHTAA